MVNSEQNLTVTVNGLHKSYIAQGRPVAAVRGVSFNIREGEFYTLLGPSGCGKTTTMRCIAGLEHSTQGEIYVQGKLVSSASKNVFVPPNKRDIGMVFQSYAIWPHMTVFQNVAFPLNVAGIKTNSKEMRDRVDEALALVELEGYGDRFATQLSGGQQQRLALARAIVRRPALLLLDEPLSNLDARLRDTMRTELRALQRRLGITTLYVTHDQTEALSMSSRIAVMENGEIVQEATPRELYGAPSNAFVAEFLGVSNSIPCTVSEIGSDCTVEDELRSRARHELGRHECRRDRRRGDPPGASAYPPQRRRRQRLCRPHPVDLVLRRTIGVPRRSERRGAARARAVGYGVRRGRRRVARAAATVVPIDR